MDEYIYEIHKAYEITDGSVNLPKVYRMLTFVYGNDTNADSDNTPTPTPMTMTCT